jgi:hypothetical protein
MISDIDASLHGVLQHINFTEQVGQSRIPDAKPWQLAQHFSKHRLLDEDFEFPTSSASARRRRAGTCRACIGGRVV